MTATKAIRDQIYNILNDMSPIAGTVKTAAQYIPRAIADYEGYMIRIRLTNNVSTRKSREVRSEAQVWTLELFSPLENIGFYDEVEDAMYDYRDAVYSEFDNNRTLEYNGTSLAGINGVFITNDNFLWGANTDYEYRHVWNCSLSLENLVSCRS